MQIFARETGFPIATPDPAGGPAMYRFRWPAMGTHCELQFSTNRTEQARAFQEAAMKWVEDFEARYSRFRLNSQISRINDAAGRHAVEIDSETEKILDVCSSIYTMTEGILDVTALPLMRLWNYRSPTPQIPRRAEIEAALALVGWNKIERKPGSIFLPRAGMSIDLGGWGKEYAVDAVAQIGRELGIENGLVDFGHDIKAWGAPLGKPAWHVGLEDPLNPGTHRGSIAVRDCAIASSGDYLRQFSIGGRRFGHIIDPRSGEPVSNGCTQVTVVAPSCLQAGILSTTAFILGAEKGIALIQGSMQAEGMILAQKARHQTREFFKYVVAN